MKSTKTQLKEANHRIAYLQASMNKMDEDGAEIYEQLNKAVELASQTSAMLLSREERIGALEKRNRELEGIQNHNESIADAVQEGRNQVLYLLLAAGDNFMVHDNFQPAEAEKLLVLRRRLVEELARRDKWTNSWPPEYPDFMAYTYRSS